MSTLIAGSATAMENFFEMIRSFSVLVDSELVGQEEAIRKIVDEGTSQALKTSSDLTFRVSPDAQFVFVGDRGAFFRRSGNGLLQDLALYAAFGSKTFLTTLVFGKVGTLVELDGVLAVVEDRFPYSPEKSLFKLTLFNLTDEQRKALPTLPAKIYNFRKTIDGSIALDLSA